MVQDVGRMNRLREIRDTFRFHGTDKLNHGYAMIYDKVLPDIQNILEIGVGNCASIRAWLDLFPSATVHGVDKEQISGTGRPDFIFHYCNIKEFEPEWIDFDLIVDDGSHQEDEIIAGWEKLHQLCKGLYVIEDVQCGLDKIIGVMRQNCEVISVLQCGPNDGDTAIVGSFKRVIAW